MIWSADLQFGKASHAVFEISESSTLNHFNSRTTVFLMPCSFREAKGYCRSNRDTKVFMIL